MSETGTRPGDIVAQIHTQLREAILSGEIRPGEKTSQAELARDYGFSRTPLREAVRMLQNEGLLLAEPNQRVEVARLSIEDAEELYVARISLEVAAARITLPVLTRSDIAELEGYMAQMAHLASSGSLALFGVPHRSFHERFVVGAGPRLVGIMSELSDHSERYRRVYGAAFPFSDREAEHRSMLDAVIAGDADRLAEAMTFHYVQTARLVTSALDPAYPFDRLRVVVQTVAPGAMYALG